MSEDTFILLEILSGVVCVVLALFLNFSKLPDGALKQRNKLGRKYLVLAFVVNAVFAVFLSIMLGKYEEPNMVALFIQSFTPVQTLLFFCALIYPIYLKKDYGKLLFRETIFVSVLTIFNVTSGILDSSNLVRYVLLLLYIVLFFQYVRMFILISRQWLNFHPETKTMFKSRLYPLWLVSCVMCICSVFTCVLPNRMLLLIFTAFYSVFYVYFAIQYFNLGFFAIDDNICMGVSERKTEISDITSGKKNIACECPSLESSSKSKRTEIDLKSIEDNINKWKLQKNFLHAKLTIQMVSKDVGINQTYLSNFINDVYKTNFNRWINGLRIDEAKCLLMEKPEMSLADVAEAVGFADLAHFSKQFKLKEGISPSIWRKNCN